ncbi:ankyrin repeat-containing domain protein [Phaeosphaeriaceae sp. PMI808]|nr:ankyrin repeat-containing domain protein [Phaeosphaeriaceae sp. PMI808]
MTKRPAQDNEWELHKDVIIDLYLNQNKSLPDVMRTMTEQGFRRTKSQYENAFKTWNITKNISKDEWKFIVARLQDRESRKKPTKVRVRGSLVLPSKIQKQRKLYETSTFDRIATRKFRPDCVFSGEEDVNPSLELCKIQRPQTPPGVEVFTPVPSPGSFSEFDTMELQSFISNDLSLWDIHMPFIQFYDQLSITGFFPNLAPTAQSRANFLENLLPQLHLNILPNSWADINTRHNPSGQLTAFDTAANSMLQKSKAYLPPMLVNKWCSSSESAIGLPNITTEAQFIILMVGALSNNFETDKMVEVVIELTENQSYRALLKELLERKLDTVSAFAEKLLIPAVKFNRLDLVKMLIKSGVDINLTSDYYLDGEEHTALYYAVEFEGVNYEIVKYLLDHGATDLTASYWMARSPHSDQMIFGGEILALATQYDDDRLVDLLVRHAESCAVVFPEKTMKTLVDAISSGHVGATKVLIESQPGLFKAAKRTPWILYELAAASPSTGDTQSMISLLNEKGLDFSATDAYGCGSLLAAAALRVDNISLFQTLLSEGALVDGLAAGTSSSRDGYKILRHIRGKSALYIAVQSNNKFAVRLLLDHGANPNLACDQHYPIQLAAKLGHLEIVKMLIEAGSNINGTIDHMDTCAPSHIANGELPAVQLALIGGYIEIAEALHIAGVSPFKAITGTLKDQLLKNVFTMGSRKLLLDVVQHFPTGSSEPSASEVLEITYLDYVAMRFGTRYVDDLITLGIVTRGASIRLDMYRAIKDRNTHALEALLGDSNMKFNGLPSQDGVRALILAMECDSVDMVQIILRAGADPFETLYSTQYEPFLGELFGNVRSMRGESAFTRVSSMCSSNGCYNAMFFKNVIKIAEHMLRWRPQNLVSHQQMCQASLQAYCRVTKQCRSRYSEHCDDDCVKHCHGRCDKLCSQLQEILCFYGVTCEAAIRGLRSSYVEKILVTALINSISCEHHHDMKRILEKASTFEGLINPSLSDVTTPLQQAASEKKTQLVRELIGLGANVNADPQKNRGATALQFAAINGDFEILDMLLDAGANINAAPGDRDGRTAIEGAAEWGHLDMIKYLLDKGADIQNPQNYRRTVYRAWTKGHQTQARVVQRWRMEKYPSQKCEPFEEIIKNMDDDELYFVDEAAKKRFYSRSWSSNLATLPLPFFSFPV